MVLGTSFQSGQRQPTILVIEDEEAIAGLLRDELSSLGYKVILARDGLQGLEQIQNAEPDLVICDRAMPAMTGSELLERLRGLYPQYKTIPFIFLTALTGQKEKNAVQQLQPFAYLEKPLDFGLLQRTIEQALMGH
jgi:CheY-like chemotaxis protein